MAYSQLIVAVSVIKGHFVHKSTTWNEMAIKSPYPPWRLFQITVYLYIYISLKK